MNTPDIPSQLSEAARRRHVTLLRELQQFGAQVSDEQTLPEITARRLDGDDRQPWSERRDTESV